MTVVGTETRERGGAAPDRTSGLAIASFALAVIGFFALPLIGSILAIVVGRSAERELERDRSLRGDGLARAGIVLGWIGAVVVLAGFLFALLLAVAFL